MLAVFLCVVFLTIKLAVYDYWQPQGGGRQKRNVFLVNKVCSGMPILKQLLFFIES